MAIGNNLATRLGPKDWFTDDIDGYQKDWLGMQDHAALGMAPSQQPRGGWRHALVSCAGVPVTPQVATSACAGAVPGAGGHVILSLSHMSPIGAVDNRDQGRTRGNETVPRCSER